MSGGSVLITFESVKVFDEFGDIGAEVSEVGQARFFVQWCEVALDGLNESRRALVKSLLHSFELEGK